MKPTYSNYLLIVEAIAKAKKEGVTYKGITFENGDNPKTIYWLDVGIY